MNLQEAIDIINNDKDTTEPVSEIKRNLLDKIIDYLISNKFRYQFQTNGIGRMCSELDLYSIASNTLTKQLAPVEATYYGPDGEVTKTEYQVIKNYGDGAVQYRTASIEECKKYIKWIAFS